MVFQANRTVIILLLLLLAVIFVGDLVFLRNAKSRRARCRAHAQARVFPSKPKSSKTQTPAADLKRNQHANTVAGTAHFMQAINISSLAPSAPRTENLTQWQHDSAHGGSCMVIEGGSHIGGDYFTLPAVTAGQCCDACVADPNCVVWTLQMRTCWLKDHFPGPYLVAPPRKRDSYTTGYVRGREAGAFSCLSSPTRLQVREPEPTLPAPAPDGDITTPIAAPTNSSFASCAHNPLQAYIGRRPLIFGLIHGLTNNGSLRLSANLEEFGRLFKDYRVLIYDNDHPCSHLPQIARNNTRVRYISEYLQLPSAMKLERVIGCGRTRTLAHLRNRVLQRAREWLTSAIEQRLDPFTPDLVIHIDFDQMVTNGIKAELIGPALCTALRDYRGWDQLCAYGAARGKYFDTFALRTCEVEFYQAAHNYSMAAASALDLAFAISPWTKPPLHPLPRMVRVRSCFGALTVMRVELLLERACNYVERTCMCEHVPYQSCLARHGFDNIFIDTELRVNYAQNGNRPGLKSNETLADCADGYLQWTPIEQTKAPRNTTRPNLPQPQTSAVTDTLPSTQLSSLPPPPPPPRATRVKTPRPMKRYEIQ